MPFRTAGSRGAFSPSDVELLQSAYNVARELLGHSSTTDEELDQLARLIIRLFENGERAPPNYCKALRRNKQADATKMRIFYAFSFRSLHRNIQPRPTA